MSVTPTDFIALSKELIGSEGCSEVHFRSAVSRAYYAVYHQALNTADELGLPDSSPNQGEHKKLISRFSSAGKRLKVIADRINVIRASRVDADYKLFSGFSIQDAQKQIRACDYLISELVRLELGSSSKEGERA